MEKKLNSLSEVKNIHKGCRAFILGSGPSLNSFDFGKISNNDVIFSCNQSITVLHHSNYFCMSDGNVPVSIFFDYGISISDKVVFFNIDFFKLPEELLQKVENKSYFLGRRHNDSSNFDFNLNDEKLIVGLDVIHVTSHLAHVMGCTPIVLVGVDLNYNNGKKYCDSTAFKEKVVWPIELFNPQKAPLGEYDSDLCRSFNAWKKIKDINKNIIFLNANPNGKLSEIFKTFMW